MARVLILGGGFGGIVAANALRALLPAEHHVTVIERQSAFAPGANNLWIMLGDAQRQLRPRPVAALEARGVAVVADEIRAIDPAAVRVETAAHGALSADFLVIALGAELDMTLIPGLAAAAETYYTAEGAARCRDRLGAFEGGDLVTLVSRMPYKCPPAPYEAAMMLGDLLERRGIRARAKLAIYTPEPQPLGTGGPVMGDALKKMLAMRGIKLATGMTAAEIDPAGREIRFEDGSRAHFDLLLAVPPHVAPGVVREACLAKPWIPVDRFTCEVPGLDGRVYAIGDVTSIALPGRHNPDVPLNLPKAGTFAESEARVVAKHIASKILGGASDAAFDGYGECYVEVQHGLALKGQGYFFDEPPRMVPTEPSAQSYQLKREQLLALLDENLAPAEAPH
ncbi:MAG: NAD(P)/FAD-dependent oxidoreductase [Candidatus Sericytochromatia bacterium]|nr:NAD(P)/FAD-dependent oxidoreductase [Candidatus Tanganyikabacteria bacterium]